MKAVARHSTSQPVSCHASSQAAQKLFEDDASAGRVGVACAAGPSSFIGETLTRLHAHNIVAPEQGPFPKLNPEYVVRANPALIMVGARSAAGLEQRPGWGGIDAVKHGRVCRFTAEQSDMVVRPGPRMAEAARLMAGCLARMVPAEGRVAE